MTVSAITVVFSHLSDAQMEIKSAPNLVVHRTEFVKYIIHKLEGDLNQDIDPDALWSEYLEKLDESKNG